MKTANLDNRKRKTENTFNSSFLFRSFVKLIFTLCWTTNMHYVFGFYFPILFNKHKHKQNINDCEYSIWMINVGYRRLNTSVIRIWWTATCGASFKICLKSFLYSMYVSDCETCSSRPYGVKVHRSNSMPVLQFCDESANHCNSIVVFSARLMFMVFNLPRAPLYNDTQSWGETRRENSIKWRNTPNKFAQVRAFSSKLSSIDWLSSSLRLPNETQTIIRREWEREREKQRKAGLTSS